MKKRWLGILCLLLLTLCLAWNVQAEDAEVEVLIPQIQAGQNATFTFSYEENTINSITAQLYVKGSEQNVLKTMYFFSPTGTSQERTIDGYLLQAGEYTLTAEWREKATGAVKTLSRDFTVAEGNQPAKPVVNMPVTALYQGEWVECFFVSPRSYYGSLVYQTVAEGTAWEKAVSSTDYCDNGNFRMTLYGSFDEPGTIDYQIRFCYQEGGIYSAWSDPTDITLTYCGSLAEPEITIASGKTIGQDIPFSFVCDHAEGFSASLSQVTDGYDRYIDSLESEEGSYSFTGTSGSIVYPLLEAGTYKLTIYPSAPGYDSSDGSQTFTVASGSLSAGPQVTLNEGRDIYADQNMPLSVSMENLDQIIVETYDSEGNTRGAFRNWAPEPGHVTVSAYSGSVGDYTVKVWGHANEKWTQATEISYTALAKQPLPDPVAVLSADTLEAGTDLTITFENNPLVSRYYCYVQKEDADGSWSWVCSQNAYPYESLQVSVDGYYFLDAGNYRVNYYSCPADENAYYTSSTLSKAFTVTESTLSKTSFTLEAQDAYYVSQELTASFGGVCDELRLNVYEAGSDYTYREFEDSGSSQIVFSINDTGNYELKGIAKRNGRWLPWSNAVPLTIVSKGSLNGGSIILDSASANILTGTDLTGSVEMDANASYGHLYLKRFIESRGDWDWLESRDVTHDNNTFFFNGESLSAGTYMLELESYGAGYEAGLSSITFTVSGTQDAGPLVTVPAEIFVDNYCRFSLNLPGASDLKLRYNQGPDFSDVDSYWFTQNVQGTDTFVWSQSFSRTGIWGVRASAKVNGRWTLWSDPVMFTVSSRGTLTAPELTLPEGEIASGDDLPVLYAYDPLTENANYTLYQWKNGYYDWQFNQYINEYDLNGAFIIKGYNLSPGRYRLRLELRASGYQYSFTEAEFNVTGQETAGPVVTFDRETCYAGEQVTIILDKTYEAICVNANGNTRFFTNSDRVTWNLPYYSTESWSVRVKARTNGVWSQWTTAHTPIQIRDVLSSPELTVVKSVLGEDIQIRVSSVEHAMRYQLNIEDENGESVTTAYLDAGGVASLDESQFHSGHYLAVCYVYGVGYEQSSGSVPFEVTGSRTGTLPTVVPAATAIYADELPVFAVTAPGASLVRMTRTGYSDVNIYSVVNGRVTVIPDYVSTGATEYRFAAKTDGNWSEWTEPVTITVEPVPEKYDFELSSPVITLSPEKPVAGNDLTVSIKSDSRASHYRIRFAYSGESDWFGDPFIADGLISNHAQTLITIPGHDLSRSGAYELEVWTDAPNAKTGYTKQFVSVSGTSTYAKAPTVTYSVESDTVPVGQPIPFTVSTSEGLISRIRGILTYTGNNYESFYSFESVGEAASIQHSVNFHDYLVGQNVTFAVSAKINGIWSDYTEHTFHVVRAQEIVDNPVPVLSSVNVTAGDPLQVTWTGVDPEKVRYIYVDWYHDGYHYSSDNLAGSASEYTIDTSNFESGTYYVYLFLVTAEGYQRSGDSIYAAFHVKTTSAGQLLTLNLPSALKTIEEEAFAGTNAQRIVIPSGCTRIGSRAFAFSDNLVSVVIPSSVTSIAEDAFLGCEGITIETSANSAAAKFAGRQGYAVNIK